MLEIQYQDAVLGDFDTIEQVYKVSGYLRLVGLHRDASVSCWLFCRINLQ